MLLASLGSKKRRPGYPRRSPRCAGTTAASHGLMPLMLQEIRENPDGAQAASEQDLAVPDAVPMLDKAKDPATDSISEAPPLQPEQKKDPPAKA